MQITAQADQITAFAETLGLVVARNYSNLSGSQYLVVSSADDEGETIEIRISNHAQRPTYYRRVDFEIGEHLEAHGFDWRSTKLPEKLAEMSGQPDAAVNLRAQHKVRSTAAGKAAVTRRVKARAAEQEAAETLLSECLNAKGSVPTGDEIARRFNLPRAAAARVRRTVVYERKKARKG